MTPGEYARQSEREAERLLGRSSAPQTTEDPLAAVRGLAIGFVIGFAIWALVLAAGYMLAHI